MGKVIKFPDRTTIKAPEAKVQLEDLGLRALFSPEEIAELKAELDEMEAEDAPVSPDQD